MDGAPWMTVWIVESGMLSLDWLPEESGRNAAFLPESRRKCA